MPRRTIAAEHVAIGRVLLAAHWTHKRVAKVLGVKSEALVGQIRGRAKTPLPSICDDALEEAVTRGFMRARAASRKAMAKAFRQMADELESK